jgi:hypothetical protein
MHLGQTKSFFQFPLVTVNRQVCQSGAFQQAAAANKRSLFMKAIKNNYLLN